MIKYLINIDGGYFDYYRVVTRQEANVFDSLDDVQKVLTELSYEDGTGDKLDDYGQNFTIEMIWIKQ